MDNTRHSAEWNREQKALSQNADYTTVQYLNGSAISLFKACSSMLTYYDYNKGNYASVFYHRIFFGAPSLPAGHSFYAPK